MGNALSDWWQFTTIAIEDDLGAERGTGVLVSDRHCAADLRTGDRAHGRVYLITAQHVLGANESEIRETREYSLCYHSPGPSRLEKKRHQIPGRVLAEQRNGLDHVAALCANPRFA